MKTTVKHIKRLLSALLCCVLLLLPLGMTAGAVFEEEPEGQEDPSRTSYIQNIDYDFQRDGTNRALKFKCNVDGVSGVHNIRVRVTLRRCPFGGSASDWYTYADYNSNSNFEKSENPMRYSYTLGNLPTGYYEATYEVRCYKILYQTAEYTTIMIAIN